MAEFERRQREQGATASGVPVPEGFVPLEEATVAPTPATSGVPVPEGFVPVEQVEQANVGAGGENSWLGDMARGVGNSAMDVLSGAIRAPSIAGEAIGDAIVEHVTNPLGITDRSPENIAAPSAVRLQQDAAADQIGDAIDYTPRTDWQDVKDAPLQNVAPFVVEQGITSLPHMIGALANLPGYIASRAGNIADNRAENDEREVAGLSDLLAAAPAAAASGVLERIGGRGMLGIGDVAVDGIKQLPRAVGKAAAKEGVGEAIDEGAEYTAATAGTKKGFDPATAADQMLAGAVGGAGFGGAVRGATGAAQIYKGKVRDAYNTANAANVPPQPSPQPTGDTSADAAVDASNPAPVARGPIEPVEPAANPVPVTAQPQVEPAAETQASQAQPAPTRAVTTAPNKSERITTPDGDFETDVEFEVVEADTLKAAEGELQPRDRASRVGSDMQIQNMASKLDPLRLMSSRESDRGAPVVDENSVILSGNGRAAAIMAAMDQHPERYEAYRTSLAQSGYNVEGMKAPVLVRRANISPDDKRRFATRSNSDGGLGLSPTERAGIEQEYVSPDMLARFDADAEGGVSSASNGNFVRDFLRRIPTNEQASFVNRDGQLTPMGAQRISGAIFARAYGDKTLVERFVEDEKDPAIRNALTGAAGAWANMRETIKGSALDITPDLVEAIGIINQAKNANMTLANFTAQQDAFRQTPKRVLDVARLFFNHTGNRIAAWRDIRDRLKSYADQASRTANADGDIFGGPGPTPEGILSGVLNGVERRANATPVEPAAPAASTSASGAELFPGNEVLARGPKRGGKPQTEPRQAANPSLLDAMDGNEGASVSPNSYPDTEEDFDFDTDTDFDQFEDSANTRAPRGSLTPQTEQVAFTNRASIYEEAFRVAGLTPDEGVLLPGGQKRNVLARVLVNTFGFKAVNTDVKNAKISPLDAADQMLDAYRNVRFMMHALQLPIKAISLDGTLTLALERFKGRYFGAYQPATKTIHMPGRSNSFAHEWAHALDHFLLGRLKPGAKSGLFTQEARNEGVDPTENIDKAFVNLINTMFFDEADLAVRIMRLEGEAAKTIQKGPDAGRPTASAIKAQEQIERLASGATRLRIKPSKFRADSQSYSPAQAGYFGSVHEMLARTFEAYVANRVTMIGGTNEFITKGDAAYLGDADRRLAMTFPKHGERLRIFAALDDVMHHVRVSAILGQGPAADRPADVDIMDPQHWNKIVLDAGEPGLVKAFANEMKAVRNAAMNVMTKGPGQSLRDGVSEFALNAGINPDQPAKQSLSDAARTALGITRAFVGSARGVLKVIVKRNNGKGGEFLDFIAGKLMTDPGTGKTQNETFEEAREAFSAIPASKIESAMKANGFNPNRQMAKDVNDRVRELLYGNKPAGASEQEKALAAELRRLFNEAHRAATNAGIEVGYVEDTGYLPRVIASPRVGKDPAKFVNDAAKVYGIVFDNETADMPPADVVTLAQETARRIEQKGEAFSNETKKLQAALKKLKALAPGADPKQAAADVEQARQDLLDVVRPEFAQVSAEDWRTRVLIGDSNTYDSHGPASNFAKHRKLPPEADQIMADWYDNDVLNLTLSYAHNVASRAAYVTRFGNSGGAKRLRDVIARKDVQDAISMHPRKYDKTTAAGRLNILRDLTNPRTDNVLEMALIEAENLGADAADVVKIRETVQDFTGRKSHGAGVAEGAVNTLSNTLYVLTYVTLLPRATATALTEPVTTLMRTGSVKAAGRSLQNYMMEAVRSAKTTQERAAFARAIGLVSTQLHDTVLMNRLSGDFGNAVGGNVILARFFRGIGLTQLTNAQRRATMASGFYWMRDMARVATDPKMDDVKKAIARAEFKDLGVSDKHMDAMLDWLVQKDEHPSLDDLNSDAGQIYAAMIRRFVDQTIQNPRRADKPMGVATPLGRMAYSLTSFLYAYFRNVHLANINRAKRNYNIAREHGHSRAVATGEAFAPAFTSFVGGFAAMAAAQFLVTTAREFLFNHEQWEDKDEDEREKWLRMLAISRTGILGPGDVFFNALTGLRYERDLSNIAIGTGASMELSHVQNIIKGLPKYELWEGGPGVGARNSPNTNTAERTAMKSVYRMALAPAMSVGLSALNAAGPVGWSARYAAMLALTSNSAANEFADVTVGEKEKKNSRN